MQMKHDLEAFSREIVSLIKTSGDSGGSGDKSKKPLQHNDFFVPTRRTVMSPVTSEWGQEVLPSGGTKCEHSQSVASRVPSVPTATTTFRQGPKPTDPSGCPTEWYAILAGLNHRQPPDWLSIERWSELISDAEDFLTRWGAAAQQFGWTALDLFGVHASLCERETG